MTNFLSCNIREKSALLVWTKINTISPVDVCLHIIIECFASVYITRHDEKPSCFGFWYVWLLCFWHAVIFFNYLESGQCKTNSDQNVYLYLIYILVNLKTRLPMKARNKLWHSFGQNALSNNKRGILQQWKAIKITQIKLVIRGNFRILFLFCFFIKTLACKMYRSNDNKKYENRILKKNSHLDSIKIQVLVLLFYNLFL